MKNITYAIHDAGYVVSRVGSEVAWPILDFAAMTLENKFRISYYLERIQVYEVSSEWDSLHWTKKIPVEIKNQHRDFWGLPRLRGHLKRRSSRRAKA